jgi:hypothetical protein
MRETPQLDTGCPAGAQGASLENLQPTPRSLDPFFELIDRPTGVVERGFEVRPDHGLRSFRESATPFSLS